MIVGQFRTDAFSLMQKLGQSLMIPVAVLPAAGLLVALGRLLQGQESLTFLKVIGNICFSGGIAIFEQLPTLFAVGVAIGFSGGAAITGLAAVAGYFTLINVLKAVTEIRGLELAINTGVFGGIMVGLLTAALYQRFHNVKLPQFLGFFAGKRLVPIVTAASSLVLGLVLSVVWPPIQQGINDFGMYVMGSAYGPSFYAAVKRLLIPVGLHHVFYPPFLYQFGEFVTSTGEVLRGEAARYFGGDPTAGKFMASEYHMMLFGLPAASLAMYLKSKKEKRKAIGGVMLAAALTSIITGITEPIEFAFIFVAPILFVYHVVFAFVGGYITTLLDIHLGYTFSASMIDLGLGAFNAKNMHLLFLVVGPLMAVVYFFSFYFTIGWLNLRTPGREDETAQENEGNITFGNLHEKAVAVLDALGGKNNIKNLDACITRLRLSVINADLVSTQILKALGAAGIMNAGGGNLQVVFGTESDALKEEMKKVMQHGHTTTAATIDASSLTAPMNGKILDLSQVPDEMFSQKMMGEGLAIDPSDGKVYAPCDGVVASIFNTNHAVAIAADNGAEVLIHVGIDTVKMKGEGFRGMVKNGERVKRGQLLIEFDLEKVKREAKSHITPFIITNSAELKGIDLIQAQGRIAAHSPLIKIRS
jgi:glucose PTS system EIICBA or EIICB component